MCQTHWRSISDAINAVLLSTMPMLRQVSTAAATQHEGFPECQQLEVSLHVSAASAVSQGVQEPLSHVTGSAGGHSAYGHAEQLHTAAHETLAATEPAGEGQRSAPVPAVSSEGMCLEASDDGREHGTHSPVLHEVPSQPPEMLLWVMAVPIHCCVRESPHCNRSHSCSRCRWSRRSPTRRGRY